MIAGAGFYYHRKNLYAGLSAPAIFPNDHFGPRLFQAHGGGIFNISSDLRLKPSLLARYLTNSPLVVSAAHEQKMVRIQARIRNILDWPRPPGT